MKIKRYVAPTMREAIAQVRAEQGPEAVILSNRRIDDGMEVIAAVDYDETLMTQAFAQIVPRARVDTAPVAKETPEPEAPVAARPAPAAVAPKAAAPAVAKKAPSTIATPAAPAAPKKAPDNIVLARKVQKPTEVERPFDRTMVIERPRMDGATFAPPRPLLAAEDPSQDAAYASIREEVHSMRELLESQLASLAWNDMGRRQPLKSKALRDLAALDIAPEITREIAAQMPPIDNLKDSWRIPLGLLVKRIPVTDDGVLEHGGVVAVVGPTGVGKTTTIAKLAARFALKHGAHHVALVSTDTYRIGAREQLHTYARILGVTMHVAQDSRELAGVLESLEHRKLVLIDTAGMSQRDLRLNEQFATLHNDKARIRVLLALSAASEYSALEETVRVFERIRPYACVLTKVDEAASLGAPISVAIKHGLAIAHICDGQRVPEDLHAAFSRRSWLVQTAVKMRRDTQRVPDEAFLAEQFGRMAAHA